MITGGRNMGRSGVIVHREKHIGDFDIVHVRDALDRTFATRYVSYLFLLLKYGGLMGMQSVQHLRHRRGHQALDIIAEGQGYQAHHRRGARRAQEAAHGGPVSDTASRLPPPVHMCYACMLYFPFYLYESTCIMALGASSIIKSFASEISCALPTALKCKDMSIQL